MEVVEAPAGTADDEVGAAPPAAAVGVDEGAGRAAAAEWCAASMTVRETLALVAGGVFIFRDSPGVGSDEGGGGGAGDDDVDAGADEELAAGEGLTLAPGTAPT